MANKKTTFQFECDLGDTECGYGVWFKSDYYEKCCKTLKDPSQIVINDSNINLCLDYPFKKEFYVNLDSNNGFMRYQLVDVIKNLYDIIYKSEELTSPSPTDYHKKLPHKNYAESDGVYGIWGYNLEDLILTTGYYNPKLKILYLGFNSLSVNS